MPRATFPRSRDPRPSIRIRLRLAAFAVAASLAFAPGAALASGMDHMRWVSGCVSIGRQASACPMPAGKHLASFQASFLGESRRAPADRVLLPQRADFPPAPLPGRPAGSVGRPTEPPGIRDAFMRLLSEGRAQSLVYG